MSHRNGNPKPHANERTLRRYRERHDISTPADEAHRSYLQGIKDKIFEWRHPKSINVNPLEIKNA